MELKVNRITADERAIQRTLDYMGAPYATTYVHTDVSLSIPREAGPADKEIELYGFLSVFTCVSRWAHTLPSDPIDAGIVVEMLDMARFSTLDDLEAYVDPNKWMCKEWDVSTAADFYLISRLKEIEITSAYPNLKGYARLDLTRELEEQLLEEQLSARRRCVVC